MKKKFSVHKSASIKIAFLLMNLFWLSTAFSQQDMQDMPGMNMKKSTPVKKPVVKSKQPVVKQKANTQKSIKDLSMQDMQMNVSDTTPHKDFLLFFRC